MVLIRARDDARYLVAVFPQRSEFPSLAALVVVVVVSIRRRQRRSHVAPAASRPPKCTLGAVGRRGAGAAIDVDRVTH